MPRHPPHHPLPGAHRPAAEAVEIDEYLMSCRVLQRGVENFAMNHIVSQARARGARQVVERYIPTSKNEMVRDFYAQFGFVRGPTERDGSTRWELDVAGYADRPAPMRQLDATWCQHDPR